MLSIPFLIFLNANRKGSDEYAMKDLIWSDLIPPDKAENVLDWESIKMLVAQNKIVVQSYVQHDTFWAISLHQEADGVTVWVRQ
jgi:hypothetical protein